MTIFWVPSGCNEEKKRARSGLLVGPLEFWAEVLFSTHTTPLSHPTVLLAKSLADMADVIVSFAEQAFSTAGEYAAGQLLGFNAWLFVFVFVASYECCFFTIYIILWYAVPCDVHTIIIEFYWRLVIFHGNSRYFSPFFYTSRPGTLSLS